MFIYSTKTVKRNATLIYDDDEVMLNVLRCQLTYLGQAETNAEARFNKSLRPRKPEGSLGRTAQDVHLDSHTAPEPSRDSDYIRCFFYNRQNNKVEART